MKTQANRPLHIRDGLIAAVGKESDSFALRPSTPIAESVWSDARSFAPPRRYYVKDHLGSVRAVVDATGDMKEVRDYYPFGLRMPGRSTTEGTPAREDFTGHEKDVETGLHYAGARYYMAAMGRWTGLDPLADKNYADSPYAYAVGNPIRYVDPTGMDTLDWDAVWGSCSWGQWCTYEGDELDPFISDDDYFSAGALAARTSQLYNFVGTVLGSGATVAAGYAAQLERRAAGIASGIPRSAGASTNFPAAFHQWRARRLQFRSFIRTSGRAFRWSTLAARLKPVGYLLAVVLATYEFGQTPTLEKGLTLTGRLAGMWLGAEGGFQMGLAIHPYAAVGLGFAGGIYGGMYGEPGVRWLYHNVRPPTKKSVWEIRRMMIRSGGY